MRLEDIPLPRTIAVQALELFEQIKEVLNTGRYEMRVVSSVPTWTANEGETVLYTSGAVWEFYAYLDGAWRKISWNTGGTVEIDGGDIESNTITWDQLHADLQARILTAVQKTDLTDGGASTLHTHAAVSPIDSIQSGEYSVSAGSGVSDVENITISAVTLAKSFCIVGIGLDRTGWDGCATCGARITTTTNLKLEWNAERAGVFKVYWQVIEFV